MGPKTLKGPHRWDAWNGVQNGHLKQILNVGSYENMSTIVQSITRMQYCEKLLCNIYGNISFIQNHMQKSCINSYCN
jgi:hypothetical protein